MRDQLLSSIATVAVFLASPTASAQFLNDIDEESSGGTAPGYANLRYIQNDGRNFDEERRRQLEIGKTTASGVEQLLGAYSYRETIDGSLWLVYEYVEHRGRAEWSVWHSEFKIYDVEVTGKRLRINVADTDKPVIIDWIYEEWSPFQRRVETRAYCETSQTIRLKEDDQHREELEQRLQEIHPGRKAVILEAVIMLEKAGIVDPGIRAAMVEAALANAELEPLKEEEMSLVE